MLGALLFPAMGPFFSLGADPHHYFLADMVRLKSGKDLRFALWGLTGVVSFPSIHTSMALTYMYGFRGMGAIGWAVIALNLFMLFSVPYFGGHYLMDMIGGACDFALSLMLVRCFPAWCRGAVLATGAPALSQN
jgi:membrane-associated phospholipid phosphatase